jgi:hypothetical protein
MFGISTRELVLAGYEWTQVQPRQQRGWFLREIRIQ